MERLHVGISTCPNDTFCFHGLLTGAVDPQGFEFRFELADVETLNQRLLAGEFDAAKGSFRAALEATEELGVLSAGAAVGRGVGPVLLGPVLLGARAEGGPAAAVEGRAARILTPGRHTTASLLYALFHAGEGEVRDVVFSEIIPALQRGAADFGVCIHEGRFTYEAAGLRLVEDLGERWEQATGAPLPLGGILARRSLGAERHGRLAAAIRASLDHAHAHPAEALVSMREHAQEHSDEVLRAHVDLYVNEDTRTLSPTAVRALATLDERARAAGITPPGAPPLEVLGVPGPG